MSARLLKIRHKVLDFDSFPFTVKVIMQVNKPLLDASFLPQRLIYIQVRVVAAGAGGHAVVAQEVGGSADALTGTQIAAVHLKHAFVQQLVQDGCRRITQRLGMRVFLGFAAMFV